MWLLVPEHEGAVGELLGDSGVKGWTLMLCFIFPPYRPMPPQR